MEIKVGDTITVKKDLKTGWYGNELVVPEMLVLAGEKVEVKSICESDNTLYIVGSVWNWAPEMFEENPPKITLEVGYRYLTDTIVQTSSQTVINNDYANENACEQFLEEYAKNYDSVEGVDICFVREAVENA